MPALRLPPVHLRSLLHPPCAPRPGHVVLAMPAHNEAGRVGEVVRRVPPVVHGRPTTCIVVDDGSDDGTAAEALSGGAKVVSHDTRRGLGAAVRSAFDVALAEGCAVVAFCDGDGEYAPEELERVVAPILDGRADYVIGTRLGGTVRHMRRHRRLGNIVLTRWVRWMVRDDDVTDGQSGFRALSADAAASATVIHDYNYAQVLTIDLLGKGFRYAEVPISYEFRRSGRSFVRLVPYLRNVVPAVLRQLAVSRRSAAQSSTT